METDTGRLPCRFSKPLTNGSQNQNGFRHAHPYTMHTSHPLQPLDLSAQECSRQIAGGLQRLLLLTSMVHLHVVSTQMCATRHDNARASCIHCRALHGGKVLRLCNLPASPTNNPLQYTDTRNNTTIMHPPALPARLSPSQHNTLSFVGQQALHSKRVTCSMLLQQACYMKLRRKPAVIQRQE